MFDYVIIDAPPLGIFTDATVLINHADGAMLVVRAGRTRYSDGRPRAGTSFRATGCSASCSIKAKT